MTKIPPKRRGIKFEVGAQLEARDSLRNWYTANIEKINYEEGKVLIHFKHWSHCHDEWFYWDSAFLRPSEGVQLRKERLQEDGQAEFCVHDQVLACWSDCRFYPAKVVAVNKEGTYMVKFYDGVIQTVKNIHVKAFSKVQKAVPFSKSREKEKQKAGSTNNDLPKEQKGVENVKDSEAATENQSRTLTENQSSVASSEDQSSAAREKQFTQAEKEEKTAVSTSTELFQEPERIENVKEGGVSAESQSSAARETRSRASVENHSRATTTTQSNATRETRSRTSTENQCSITREAQSRQTETQSITRETRSRAATETQSTATRETRSKAATETQSSAIRETRSSTARENKPSTARETRSRATIESQSRISRDHSKSSTTEADNKSKALKVGDKSRAPTDESRSGVSKDKKLKPQKKDAKDVESDSGKTLQENALERGRGREDKENVSDNDGESKIEKMTEENKSENGEEKTQQQSTKDVKRKRGRPPSISPTGAQSLRTTTLELRKRKIMLVTEVQAKQSKLEVNAVNCNTSKADEKNEQDQNRRRSLRLSSTGHREPLHQLPETPRLTSLKVQTRRETDPKETERGIKLESHAESESVLSEESAEAACEHPAPDRESSPQKLQEEKEVISEPAALSKNSTEAASDVKHIPRSQYPNKYSREPLTSAVRRSEDSLSPKALTVDLDHNSFRCKILDCSKSFRKAKLLHYHMKYFHGVEKLPDLEQSPVKRSIETRGSSALKKQAIQDSSRRRRTTSGSSHTALHMAQRNFPSSPTDKTVKIGEKRRTSAPPAVNTLNSHRPSLREKSKENQMDKLHRKQHEKDREKEKSPEIVMKEKEKDKNKERKIKDFLKVKLKKKKKKKKKSKLEYFGSEENIDISREFPPKKSSYFPIKLNLSHRTPFLHKHLRSSDLGHHRERVRQEDEETLSDSSTDSLFWSDDEYGQDIDVTTNTDAMPDCDDGEFGLVRCICEVQEENDFMIQCEECLCWQHGVCMGLLEDNVPEKYTCYICRDPPGQRSSLRYWYDKEWLNNGHMHGLAFLEENYSHQNAKKIVATHQLLGDVHKVIEVLHGLQLKMSILQNKDHPDLKHWCQPWKQLMANEKPLMKHSTSTEGNICKEDLTCRTLNGGIERPPGVPPVEESYITSEHCYQKPRAYYPAVEQRLVVETRGSATDDGVNRIRMNGDEVLAESLKWDLDQEISSIQFEEMQEHCMGVPKKTLLEKEEEECEVKVLEEENEGAANIQLQWQLNLLAHVESLQDEVTHRMDFIEKELDVLESWLDYTGELEPPEPLARLPQLKHRIKQLLTDLGKVQQIAVCST
ncbi:PHD finger protein 20b isoform X1 [Latimeria chalumnae]|uniref:PHD finger protein 20b isoform X1 n=1 Tax=Latimeria chalumnae TaxID=7897 RepID=UPI0003C15897|nr:PREDICTED: PHD finger protein 20 isoform X3 [Latimeria chalumnae]XP_005986725.1 PREDICTED: PHD finger protein 20 isoform X3 [Latimeria chalumnae]|eukprot:XP_005986724.1 PREDICTED: PHD finger protein 20 isoform X3 [Latimeria chalumnae]